MLDLEKETQKLLDSIPDNKDLVSELAGKALTNSDSLDQVPWTITKIYNQLRRKRFPQLSIILDQKNDYSLNNDFLLDFVLATHCMDISNPGMHRYCDRTDWCALTEEMTGELNLCTPQGRAELARMEKSIHENDGTSIVKYVEPFMIVDDYSVVEYYAADKTGPNMTIYPRDILIDSLYQPVTVLEAYLLFVLKRQTELFTS